MVSVIPFAYLRISGDGIKKTLECSVQGKCKYKEKGKCYEGAELKRDEIRLPGCKASSGTFLYNFNQDFYKAQIHRNSLIV